ncbi:hypothetical protein AB8E32_18045 [Marinomonas polaris]|uniref:hypothetical protein n=1 Tax=Marinomonas polaris TaxID=293552 RepID=UPI0035170934
MNKEIVFARKSKYDNFINSLNKAMKKETFHYLYTNGKINLPITISLTFLSLLTIFSCLITSNIIKNEPNHTDIFLIISYSIAIASSFLTMAYLLIKSIKRIFKYKLWNKLNREKINIEIILEVINENNEDFNNIKSILEKKVEPRSASLQWFFGIAFLIIKTFILLSTSLEVIEYLTKNEDDLLDFLVLNKRFNTFDFTAYLLLTTLIINIYLFKREKEMTSDLKKILCFM